MTRDIRIASLNNLINSALADGNTRAAVIYMNKLTQVKAMSDAEFNADVSRMHPKAL